ncbi:hypothetical protein [Halomonas sp. 707B3]|uniref:hypothetical protein n=1 Tax=Halomonas sp. 707B3 TaxID=1681043 RepID=UPI00209E2F65|nr:hypothetical protein [Halomonas sp. 707B3]MCP1316868.1 hypothetical protein [Halomonas sp. 707B3]
MNTSLHLTAGNLYRVVNNLTFYKAEAIADHAPNEVAIYFDGENEFVLNNATGLDYYRWELMAGDESQATFYARDVDHARRLAATTADHHPADTDFYLIDEENEVHQL